jgi:cytidylate kinase
MVAPMSSSRTFAPVVTLSASYGAGGSIIGPRLAETLGLPFMDRLISADLSQDAARNASGDSPYGDGRSEEGLSEGEREATAGSRLLSYFARAASVGAVIPPEPALDDDTTLRDRTEQSLRDVANGASAVVLGRAGAVVLAARPRAYHVRLDAPVERRLAWAAHFEHIDTTGLEKRQSEADRARTQYVKRLYRVDPADPRLYHLVLDPTVLGVDRTLDLLAAAAGAFFEANPA